MINCYFNHSLFSFRPQYTHLSTSLTSQSLCVFTSLSSLDFMVPHFINFIKFLTSTLNSHPRFYFTHVCPKAAKNCWRKSYNFVCGCYQKWHKPKLAFNTDLQYYNVSLVRILPPSLVTFQTFKFSKNKKQKIPQKSWVLCEISFHF